MAWGSLSPGPRPGSESLVWGAGAGLEATALVMSQPGVGGQSLLASPLLAMFPYGGHCPSFLVSWGTAHVAGSHVTPRSLCCSSAAGKSTPGRVSCRTLVATGGVGVPLGADPPTALQGCPCDLQFSGPAEVLQQGNRAEQSLWAAHGPHRPQRCRR